MTKSNPSSGQKHHLKPAILQKILSFKRQNSDNISKSNALPSLKMSLSRLNSAPATNNISRQTSTQKKYVKNPSRTPSSPPSMSGPEGIERQNSKQKRESQVEKMRNRLNVGQFRFISEQLYTQTSDEAKELFGEKPELFYAYQRGYLRQQRQWPSNPLDAIISELQQEIKVMNECNGGSLTIADFGCGEARLARTILGNSENDGAESPTKVTIHSFDFVSANEHVVAGDMAHTNLSNGSVDIAVFCLSLMGTNVNDFLSEANRVLKNGGRLRIAEVRSRFESVAKFIKKLKSFGFKLTELRGTDAASFFTHFTFTKVSPIKRAKVEIKLAPCIYKKR